MHMTLRRVAPLMLAATDQRAIHADVVRAGLACEQRRRERNRSKLARRLRRKVELGLAGAL